jgi:hypothetical protein
MLPRTSERRFAIVCAQRVSFRAALRVSDPWQMSPHKSAAEFTFRRRSALRRILAYPGNQAMNARKKPRTSDERASGHGSSFEPERGAQSKNSGGDHDVDESAHTPRVAIHRFARAVLLAVRREHWMRALQLGHRNSLGFLLVCTAALCWWAGHDLMARNPKNNASEKAGYSPPPENAPPTSQTALNNNKTAELHLPTDLEGTAVLYPPEVDGLVSPAGTFRTNLSLSELARVLKVDARTIAKSGSNVEVDPDAVLFKAVAGRLSENAKAQARRIREKQVSQGMTGWAVGEEWVQRKLSFSLNALIHPSADQKSVLDAISRSARLLREPGAKVSAAPLLFDRKGEQADFFPGFLPLEPAPS